jgi:hypothetical protein
MEKYGFNQIYRDWLKAIEDYRKRPSLDTQMEMQRCEDRAKTSREVMKVDLERMKRKSVWWPF